MMIRGANLRITWRSQSCTTLATAMMKFLSSFQLNVLTALSGETSNLESVDLEVGIVNCLAVLMSGPSYYHNYR